MNNVRDCLRERGLIKRQAHEIVNDRNAWSGLPRKCALDLVPRDEP